MMGALQRVLTDPDGFYAEHEAAGELKYAAGVVAVVAVLALVESVLVLSKLLTAVDPSLRGFFVAGAAIGAVGAIAGPFIAWLVYAALFHGISALFDGEGEFRDVFVYAGWGFGPRLFAAVISVAVTAFLATQVPVPDVAAAESAQAWQQYSRTLQDHPLTLLSDAVNVLALLWSAYIWVPAFQRARDVSRQGALVAVGVPVVLAILLTVVPRFLF